MPREGLRNARKVVETTETAPWLNWGEQDRASRAIRFIEEYLILPKGYGANKNVRLAEFQKTWIRRIFTQGINSAVLSLPRSNGKSTLLAALALWALFDPDQEVGAPQVPIVATTMNQAIRSVYGVATQMVEKADELRWRSIKYSAIGAQKLVVPSNGGEMFPISNDVDGLQGLDPSLAVCDEIGFMPEESWASIVLASGKRPRSLVVGIGTPGLDYENALWKLRKVVKDGGEIPGFVFTEYAAKEGCAIDDEWEWEQANPALVEGFMDRGAFRTEMLMTNAAHFRIFKLGQWVRGTDCWLGSDGRTIWDNIREPYEFRLKAPTWIGVDMGLYKDSTAVASVQYRDDGRLHVKVKVWVPQKDTPVDITEVMGYLRELCSNYQVGAISYDPRLFEYPAMILHEEGLPMVNIPQSPARMVPIIGNVYERILNKEITHDDDEVFATQVLNAIPKLYENGFTLQKSKSRGRIDAAVAMSLAVDRAIFKTPPRPPVVALSLRGGD